MSSVYPFISGGGLEAMRRARATLKIDCLLHERATLPGSLAIGNPFIRALVMSSLEFVRSGALVLDLRDECASFAELAALRYGASPEARRAADEYDRVAPDRLRFSATDTSSYFRERMVEHLEALLPHVRKREVRAVLEADLRRLAGAAEMFTLDHATALGGRTHHAPRIRDAARYHYCVAGALAVNATPQVPRVLWNAAGRVPGAHPVDAVAHANAAIFEYFFIDMRSIDHLTPEQILDLKEEGLVRQFRRELGALVAQAQRNVGEHGLDSSVTGSTTALSDEVRRLVFARIQKERGRGKWEKTAMRALEETAGPFIPGLTLVTSAVKRLATVVRRTRLDWSTTPFLDYKDRVHARAEATRDPAREERA